MSEISKEKQRMLDIMRSFENTKENIKESTKEVDEVKILKENERLKNLVSGRPNEEFKNENYYSPGRLGGAGQGKTVNTFMDNYQNMPTLNTPKSEPANLKPEEALEICVKRTLKSGTPINNISFYDEINWNLMNLGFPAVNPIKIKEFIGSFIKE